MRNNKQAVQRAHRQNAILKNKNSLKDLLELIKQSGKATSRRRAFEQTFFSAGLTGSVHDIPVYFAPAKRIPILNDSN